MLSRLVRVINVTLGILVVVIGVAIYRFAIRPLPQTSGSITAPIKGAATVKRDARGVPHIEAASWEDAFFLQGYATAQDRLWQMDGLRRFGAGELAEVFGPGVLAQDERSRRMRIRPVAETWARELAGRDRIAFEQYARGVNFFINKHRGNYPLEFSLPGRSYTPKPWTVVDSIIVGLVMYRDLTDTSATDLLRARLFGMASSTAKLKILFPPVQGEYVSPGSNSWAVAGSRTVDGKPMLANDPHLAYGIPCTWHLVHIKSPEIDVSGAALPGIPGVIGGHNAHIAWGMTLLHADVIDWYIEQLDTKSGRYTFQNRVEQARKETATIQVHGAQPVRVDTWVTRHGPVFVSQDGKPLSMRWSAYDGFSFPFLAIDCARSWEEFRAALSTFWGPAQNFIYADGAGNIGFQAGGRIPIRKGFHGDVPLDGASGRFEWAGYIPFDQMPNVYNPASGIVATANQDPFPPDYGYEVDGNFADPYRVRQILARLSAGPKLKVADMLSIQTDVYSAYDHFLARQAVAAASRKGTSDPLVREAVQVLESWNGQMDRGQPAPVITELLSARLGTALILTAIAPSENPTVAKKTAQTRLVTIPPLLPRPQVIENLLRNRPQKWIEKDDWDGWLLMNLALSLQDGRAQQGSPIFKWRWGRVLRWNVQHPIGKQLPFVNRYFDIGPIEMSGSGTTVKQTTVTLGPSERMVVDFANLDRSVQNLPTGESGAVASGHYRDQWDAYYNGRSFPMEFNQVEAKDILRVNPGIN